MTVLSRSEVKKLAKNATPHARRMILLVASTGLRFDELAALRWEGVDFRRKQIALPFGRLWGPQEVRVGSAAMAVLRKARLAGGDRVFPPDGASLRQLRAELRAACDAAGLPRLSYADLQNTWGYWWIRCGKSWHEVALVLDVSDSEVLHRYRELVEDYQPRPSNRFTLGELPAPPDNVVPFPTHLVMSGHR